MQVLIESEIGSELWTHQNRIGSKALSPSLPNIHKLDIMNVNSYLIVFIIVLIVYSLTDVRKRAFYWTNGGDVGIFSRVL